MKLKLQVEPYTVKTLCRHDSNILIFLNKIQKECDDDKHHHTLAIPIIRRARRSRARLIIGGGTKLGLTES